jgi:hypothetical protein
MQKITGGGTKVAARGITMTNQQQTDSIVKYSTYFNTIFKGFVRPDKNFKLAADGTMTLSDTIFTNTILVKKKLTVALETQIIDTLLPPEPQKIATKRDGRFNYVLGKTDLEDAIWVREFYENLTDNLYREIDSLKAIIKR